MSDERVVEEWREHGLPPTHRAVAYVADKLYQAHPPRRWWQRRLTRFDFIPMAREAVAALVLLPEGRALMVDALASAAGKDEK